MTAEKRNNVPSMAFLFLIFTLGLCSACATTPLYQVKTEKELKKWLEDGHSPTTPDKNGITPLVHMARGSRVESVQMAKLLLDRGASVDARSRNGETPLHTASGVCILFNDRDMVRQSELVRLLIQRGADVNAKSDQGLTPLHYAFGPNIVSQELIRAGADATILSKEGFSPIEYAYQKNYPGPQRPATQVAFIETKAAKETLTAKGSGKNSGAKIPMVVLKPISPNDIGTYDEMKHHSPMRFLRKGYCYGFQVLPGKYELSLNILLIFVGQGNTSLKGTIPVGKTVIEVEAGGYYELLVDDKGQLSLQPKVLSAPLF